MMMRRDSLKSALKACAFTPFCLSTFSAICSLVLTECILPSTLRANITEEPDNKKRTNNINTITFGMDTPSLFKKAAAAAGAPWQDFIFGSAPAKADTTDANDARAAFWAKAQKQLQWNLLLVSASLQSWKLTSQCFAGSRRELPHEGFEIFVTGVAAFACCCAISNNALQSVCPHRQRLYPIHSLPLKRCTCLREAHISSKH